MEYLDLADFIGHPGTNSTDPEHPRTPTETHQDPPEHGGRTTKETPDPSADATT